MSYLPSQISRGCAGHTGFSAILLSLSFLLLPNACLSEAFPSIFGFCVHQEHLAAAVTPP